MGESYGTLLVIGEIDGVCEALRALIYDAVVVAADEGLMAVIPTCGHGGCDDLAGELSRELATGVVFWLVEESERVFASVYYDGDLLQEYNFNPLPPDGMRAPVPNSPVGADPELFLQFGSAAMNPDRLRLALLGPNLGQVDPPPQYADQQLRTILETLRLNAALFTLDYDQALVAGLAGAVEVVAPM